jgi:hypothetical protein
MCCTFSFIEVSMQHNYTVCTILTAIVSILCTDAYSVFIEFTHFFFQSVPVDFICVLYIYVDILTWANAECELIDIGARRGYLS